MKYHFSSNRLTEGVLIDKISVGMIGFLSFRIETYQRMESPDFNAFPPTKMV